MPIEIKSNQEELKIDNNEAALNVNLVLRDGRRVSINFEGLANSLRSFKSKKSLKRSPRISSENEEEKKDLHEDKHSEKNRIGDLINLNLKIEVDNH